MTSSPKRRLQRTNRFARDLKPLPENIKLEAYSVAQKLCDNIFHPELDVKPLTGFKGYFRTVVAKDYRLVFSFNSENVYLRRIAHRKDIYRSLEL